LPALVPRLTGVGTRAVGFVVGRIQKTHHGQVLLAALHAETYKIHKTKGSVGGGGQRLLEKGHYIIVASAQDHGVVHIGSHAFEAVHQHLDNGTDIFVCMLGIDTVLLALGHHSGQIGSRLPVGNRAGDAYTSGGPGFLLQLVAALDHLPDGFRIKINIGDSAEEPFDGEAVDLGIAAQFVGVQGQGLQAVQQVILQGGYFGLLAADAGNVTTGAVGSLLTLVTEHAHGVSSLLVCCLN